jgi:16S rRNA (guanine527-N7)-methyltransferase
MSAETEIQRFGESLLRNAPTYQAEIDSASLHFLSGYFTLIKKWNDRLHLVAPCSPEEFATRHVLESLFMSHRLLPGATVADVGSGAGLPIIPCLIHRSDITATLFESAKKKAVFLREALKETETISRATVVDERFEDTQAPECDFVSCRALDRFQELLPQLIDWSPRPGTLLLFGGESMGKNLEQQRLDFTKEPIPLSDARFLFEVKLD